MTIAQIRFEEGEALLDWLEFTDALAAGHSLPKAKIDDTFLYRKDDTLLSRSAWIDGLGIAVKSATIFPGNTKLGKPGVNGGVTLFSDQDGTLEALIDFHLVTKWKTAGDSLLGALRLANPDSRNIMIVGAGTVAQSLIEAFSAGYPNATFKVWNRTASKALDLAKRNHKIVAVDDLQHGVETADIILTCTMSQTPVIKGEWLRPGQHLNMIGAYRPDMREADDEALRRSQIFTDSFETTIDHIGEFKIPLTTGAINRTDIRADYYGLDQFPAYDPNSTTLFKNGGGAHLDLMTGRHILDKWIKRTLSTIC